MTSKYLDKFSSPVAKLVRFFERSRDRWKAKQIELRKECKLLMNQTRAVEKSRARWRRRSAEAQDRIRQLERELQDLKSHCPLSEPSAVEPSAAEPS